MSYHVVEKIRFHNYAKQLPITFTLKKRVTWDQVPRVDIVRLTGSRSRVEIHVQGYPPHYLNKGQSFNTNLFTIHFR